ncbi:hypothetical protein [Polaribacter porphyrae]|uniref:Uncharacterized protein n=1 Tax=Polaribacter porphyrae TaxID=1137780 RepID=A0A2S7WN35_9FLAO|nr:hypothetical protein [Polaribacter porphyrae]PQJ79027.1 hypothetical protein BTO18_07520 [Polaribacter porphyrae]
MWFKKLTGFEETSVQKVKDNIFVDGKNIISKINKRVLNYGELQVISLEKLRKTKITDSIKGNIKVSEIIADVQDLHCNENNKNSLFQVASQFNLLEMIEPNISPEDGIDFYENDLTQGPACAIACGAGTIYRNYFVELNGQIGQTRNRQINCLKDIGRALNNKEFSLWEMKNGYALINQNGILNINKQISKLNNKEREFLKGKLKVGIQWDTEVTIKNARHNVSQIYCSALPVSYCQLDTFYYESFARLILEATYEATFYTSIKNLIKFGSNKVFLTLVGGGAFGNDIDWILESLYKVIEKFKYLPLDVKIVSYGKSSNLIREFVESYN